ncbi:hypothetical protein VPH35_133169 [Triticum aestivum]
MTVLQREVIIINCSFMFFSQKVASMLLKSGYCFVQKLSSIEKHICFRYILLKLMSKFAAMMFHIYGLQLYQLNLVPTFCTILRLIVSPNYYVMNLEGWR